DQQPSAEALWQGEGGARLPVLPALRQDPSARHSRIRLRARPSERRRAGRGRSDVRDDRGGGCGRLAGGFARGTRVEELSADAGAAGEDSAGREPLGIPTVRDRVVQTAAKLVLEPIFEADLEDCAYGYRPERSALDAVQATHRLIRRGYADVVDADLSKYFDTIPHRELMQSVARRICDPHVLRLIKLWLSVPVEERDGKGRRRLVGGKRHRRGTPQGGVISPMLANLYMNRFLKHWRMRGCGAAFRAHLVNCADDFVILSCGHAEEALTWTRGVMAKLGLSLNEAKTSVKNARAESFDFLGYTLLQRHGKEFCMNV